MELVRSIKFSASCISEDKKRYFDSNCSESLESVRKFPVPENFKWRIVNHA